MRKIALLAILIATTMLLSGCASCPCRSFFRGAPCNTCPPAVNHQQSDCGCEQGGIAPGPAGAGQMSNYGNYQDSYGGQGNGGAVFGQPLTPYSSDPYSSGQIVPNMGSSSTEVLPGPAGQ